MLSLDKPLSFDGIAVFRDHADPDQFWYLPGPVTLARRPDDRAAFSLIEYKPAVADAGVKGGGFAMFETTLHLSNQLSNKILAGVMTEPGVKTPRLSPVMFETGSVQAIALDLQGSGGTTASGSLPPGAFRAVQTILGATTPSLDEQNRAAFSLTLSQEGATILKQAFEQGLAPIGVIYTFTYSGMRPALDVEITADLEAIFNHFSASLDAQIEFVRAGIDAAFESLKQTGAIKIKVINFTGEEDEKEKEKWALDFFKEELLHKWFEPTFTPGQLAVPSADADPLADVAKFANETLHPTTPAAGSGSSTPSTGTGSTTSTTPGSTSTTPTPASQPSTPAAQPAPQPVLQPATLTPAGTTPTPLPAGQSVTHTPATSGTTETITVAGQGATVRVGGAQRALDSNGRFTVDVQPAAAPTAIEVEWPAATQQQTFDLFFEHEKPVEVGWATSPPSPTYRAYVEGTTPDDRYQTHSGIDQPSGDATWVGGERGAQRLVAWLNTLAAPRTVEVDAHASFETAPQPGSHETILTGDAQREHNMRLSMRRADVAVALIARAGTSLSTAARSHGDVDARNRPGNPPTGNPNDRVVKIAGRVAGHQSSTYRGTIERPRSVTPSVPTPQPGTPRPGTPQPGTPQPQQPRPSTSGSSGSSSMPAVISLKLKFVHQEERKRMTFSYNRAEAVKRTYAPQGFFGMMLSDLADKKSYFSEIDLDDAFFRELKILAEAPIDFERIGLSSAQVALDYGETAAPDHKHGDFVFRADDKGPKEFAVFLNSHHEVAYTQRQQFHFRPESGWDADASSIELPPERTEDRTLFINPYDTLDFIETTVRPGDIDAGVVTSTDVVLEANGPGAFHKRKTFVVLSDSPPQVWKLRAPKPLGKEKRTLTYTLTHHLKDGTTRVDPPQELTAGTLLVHDPFPQSLNIELIPLFDAAAVREVFVDVEYTDAINHYLRNERLEIKGDRTDNLKLRLAILDPAKRDFRVRFTVIGSHGEFRRLDWHTSEDEIVPIQV